MNNKNHRLKCPQCGQSDSLSRIEALYAFAQLSVTDEGWEYGGGSEMLWDTQDRQLCRPEDREFHCHGCQKDFNAPSAKRADQ